MAITPVPAKWQTFQIRMTSSKDRVELLQKAFQPYTDDLIQRLIRHWKYINLSHQHQIIQLTTAFSMIKMTNVGGTILFLAAKKLAVSYIKKIQTKSSQFFESLLKSALLATAGTYFYINYTETTLHYNTWLEIRKSIALENTTSSLYTEDPILKDHLCPITCCVMLRPVWTPTGYLFDMSSLEAINSKGNIKCPFTRRVFPSQTIRADIHRTLFVHKRIYEIITVDIKAVSTYLDINQEFTAFTNLTHKTIHACQDAILKMSEKRKDDNIITPETYQTEITTFTNLFGASPDHPLNWNLDWKTHLKNFWAYFNPGFICYE